MSEINMVLRAKLAHRFISSREWKIILTFGVSIQTARLLRKDIAKIPMVTAQRDRYIIYARVQADVK